MKDLVSIITPSYNSAKHISKTIDSAISQTYQNWEMIIVDDVSLDSANEIIEEYCKKDSRIRLIKLEQNGGAAVARNRAIKEAKGRYIAFLDADDIWLPDKLEKQVAFMEETQCPLSYTNYDVVDEDGKYCGTRKTPAELPYNELIRVNRIGCLTAMYNTEVCGKQYMPNILKC